MALWFLSPSLGIYLAFTWQHKRRKMCAELISTLTPTRRFFHSCSPRPGEPHPQLTPRSTVKTGSHVGHASQDGIYSRAGCDNIRRADFLPV
jgi:hypothetical protein